MNSNLWIERNTFKIIEKKKHSATVEFFVEVLSNLSSRGIKICIYFPFLRKKKNKIRRYYLIVGQSMSTVPLYNYF